MNALELNVKISFLSLFEANNATTKTIRNIKHEAIIEFCIDSELLTQNEIDLIENIAKNQKP